MTPARTVVVVGAVNVDLVVRADRLPTAGETVVGRRFDRHGGGKSANAAVAAARAGAPVEFVGAVGPDDFGHSALTDLAAEGIGVTRVASIDGEGTGVALIVVSADGENQIAVGAGANAALSAARVRSALELLLPGAGCVLVGTEIALDAALAAVAAAHDAGVPCVLDPAPIVAGLQAALDHGPVLTPNASECLALAQLAGLAHETVEAAAEALSGRTGAPVVVTRGGDGLLLVRPGADPVHVAAVGVTVVDTTGAGDTVTGVLAARLAAGDDVRTAAEAANVAGARAVTRVGAR